MAAGQAGIITEAVFRIHDRYKSFDRPSTLVTAISSNLIGFSQPSSFVCVGCCTVIRALDGRPSFSFIVD